MKSHSVGPADIDLPPTEPIDISWALETNTTDRLCAQGR
jgi:hypothetical protein